MGTAQAIHNEGVDVALITGGEDSLKRHNVTERKEMSSKDKKQLSNLADEEGPIQNSLFQDGKMTNIEQYLSEDHPYLTKLIFDEIEESIKNRDKNEE